MKRDEAVDILMRRLGKRTDVGLKDIIIAEMDFAQVEILEQDATLPWFLVTEAASAVTSIGEERLSLPANFLLEYEDSALYILDADGVETELVREDWDVIKKVVKGSGKPTHYDLVGGNYLLRQIPNAVYNVNMRYYARAASLAGVYGDAGNIENIWLRWAGALLIAHTGVLVAKQYLQSDTLSALFLSQLQGAQDRLSRKSIAMEETNKQRFMEG